MKGSVVRPIRKFNGIFQNSKGYVLGECLDEPGTWVVAWHPSKSFILIHDFDDLRVVDESFDYSVFKEVEVDFSEVLSEEDIEDLKALIL